MREISKSDFMKSQGMKHDIKDSGAFKLACSLNKTEKYLVHIKCLKLALDAGYNLKRFMSITYSLRIIFLRNIWMGIMRLRYKQQKTRMN